MQAKASEIKSQSGSGVPKSAAARQSNWNLPNVLTIGRILLIIPFLWFMYEELANPASNANLWACALFFIASLTDWVDGSLARKYNLVTPLGQLFDPLADKLLVASALVMLAVFHGVYSGESYYIGVPAWMSIIIIARELAITGLRGMASAEGLVIEASSGGKWKTVVTLLGLGGMILQGTMPGATIGFGALSMDLGLASFIFMAAAVALTAWSGAVYFVRFLGAVT